MEKIDWIRVLIMSWGVLAVYRIWRTLWREYAKEELVALAWLLGIVVTMIVGWDLTWQGVGVGAVVGIGLTALVSRIWRWNFWYLGDDLVYWWATTLLGLELIVAGIGAGPLIWVMVVGKYLLLYLLAAFVRKNYRRWRWYGSGKKGIVALCWWLGWMVLTAGFGGYLGDMVLVLGGITGSLILMVGLGILSR